MHALVLENGRLELRHDYPEPEAGPDETLVQVELAGICRTDLELVAGYKGFSGVLGHELVGRRLDTGERVVAEINIPCRECAWCLQGGDERHCPHRAALGIRGRDGAFAERIAIPHRNLHRVPVSLTDRQAALVEPLAAALAVLDAVPPGAERVLLLGDGNLGTLLAQVLHRFLRLTWLGHHEKKLAPWRALGYDVHIAMPDETRFPVVVEATGNPCALMEAQLRLLPRGTLVLKSTTAEPRQLDLNALVVDEQRVVGSRCGRFQSALAALEAGWVDVDCLIEASFDLSDGLRGFEAASRRGARKVLLRCQS